MPQVKIAAQFTQDRKPYNGLSEDKHVAALIEEPQERRYALVAYDVRRITEEIEDGTEIPTVNFVQIEPVDGELAGRVKADMERLYQARTGRDDEPQPSLFDGDGERVVPDASGEEILAERAEANAATAGES